MAINSSRLPAFYRLSVAERLRLLNADAKSFSLEEGLSIRAADHMVENALGVFGIPIGVAPNFCVDGQPVVVPMAIEEPSVIAACSYMAKLVSMAGGFKTDVDEPVMIGQIQVLDLSDIDAALQQIKLHRESLIATANGFCTPLQSRGGGVLDVQPRLLLPEPEEGEGAKPMLVLHVYVHCCDAMGANVVNTVMEGLAPFVAKMLNGRIGFKILSNLADKRLARASFEMPYRLLATDHTHDNGQEVANKILEGYWFSNRDPYRACTHNKGIMNGIDAVAIATGNDFRAIEAGAHAYACRSGKYKSLSHFEKDDEKKLLKGSIELPLSVGVVGGMTTFHPSVVASLKILGSFGKSAKRLAGLMASVGLAQNLGALRALACEGIQKGHMALHARKKQSSDGESA